jgi:ribosomal protein RSM22 (predicted rRNA methylase)
MPPPFSLPPRLQAALNLALAGRGQRDLRTGSAGLTEIYRCGGRSTEAIDFGAYLAVRLPATYAAVMRVLAELAELAPEFGPLSFADIGAGPGTASWAAAELWPGLRHFALYDNNQAFLALAQGLAQQSGHPALATAEARLADMKEYAGSATLAVAAYALAEVSEERAGEIANRLWSRTEGALAIIEPGTTAGFSRVKRARAALIAAGGHIAAPCTHANPCPLADGDWCHFSVRLPRTRLHMQAKGAAVPFEDERFSYVIATRFPVVRAGARIIAPVEASKASVRLKLCAASGVALHAIARRDNANYKRARKLDWGDAI